MYFIEVAGLVALVALTILFACVVKCKRRRRQQMRLRQQAAQQSLMRNQNGVPIAYGV
jgi:outer membrane biogenesis lipoprotein LolB